MDFDLSDAATTTLPSERSATLAMHRNKRELEDHRADLAEDLRLGEDPCEDHLEAVEEEDEAAVLGAIDRVHTDQTLIVEIPCVSCSMMIFDWHHSVLFVELDFVPLIYPHRVICRCTLTYSLYLTHFLMDVNQPNDAL